MRQCSDCHSASRLCSPSMAEGQCGDGKTILSLRIVSLHRRYSITVTTGHKHKLNKDAFEHFVHYDDILFPTMYVHVCACICTFVHVRTRVCMHVIICMYVCMCCRRRYVYYDILFPILQICVHAYVCLFTYGHVYVCM